MPEEICRQLLKNGIDFLNHSLKMVVDPKSDAVQAKLAVVNLQIALELLIKYRLAKDFGLQSICLTDLKTVPDLSSAVAEGKVKTQTYELCRQGILKRLNLEDYERDLLSQFQRHRNAIVHFSLNVQRDESIVACAHLVLKVIRRILESEPETWLKHYLDPTVYKALTDFKPYVDEAVEDAHTIGEETKLCYECSKETLTLLPNGDYYCFCCGTHNCSEHVPYADCPFCKGHMCVAYDVLNPDNGIFQGKCLRCDEMLLVAECTSCSAHVFPNVLPRQEKGLWYCEECYMMLFGSSAKGSPRNKRLQ